MTRKFQPEQDSPSADSRAALSSLVEDSGLSIAEYARVVLGRDERTLRRWLSGEVAIPESASAWIARVARVDVTSGRVTISVDR